MDPGQLLTIWLARAAAALYLLALILIFRKADRARIVWTTGLVIYLLHVVAAFEFFYGWSHQAAFRETARQTEELFGIHWGGGLWLNYIFTIVWSADCLWWWWKPQSYRDRPVGISAAVHGFLAFMFFNATIVVWILRASG